MKLQYLKTFYTIAGTGRVTKEIKNLHKGEEVAIGTSAVIGIYCLPQIYSQFRSQFPEVVIDNRIGNSQWGSGEGVGIEG